MAPVIPAGEYSSVVLHGDQVFVAGMTPKVDNTLVATGRVGRDVGVDDGRRLAGIAARRAIAAVEQACGSEASFVPLSMTVFVSCTEVFTDLSAVADGASQVIADWSGGLLPVRAAVGVQTLPQHAPVEVSLVVAHRSPDQRGRS